MCSGYIVIDKPNYYRCGQQQRTEDTDCGHRLGSIHTTFVRRELEPIAYLITNLSQGITYRLTNSFTPT